MKKALLFLSIFNISIAFAQVPEDALRYSWYIPNGSARNMAIGGAMGSLGGEITAAFVNPAGLAFYRNAEVVITPGYIMNKNMAAYRDSNSLTKKNAMNWVFPLFKFSVRAILVRPHEHIHSHIVLLLPKFFILSCLFITVNLPKVIPVKSILFIINKIPQTEGISQSAEAGSATVYGNLSLMIS